MLIWSHPSIKGLVKAEYQTDLSLNHLFIKVVFPGNGSRIAKKLRVRTCVPRKGSDIQAASSLILRTGSPDGPQEGAVESRSCGHAGGGGGGAGGAVAQANAALLRWLPKAESRKPKGGA